MGNDASKKLAPRPLPRTARAVAYAGTMLLLVALLSPATAWFVPAGNVVAFAWKGTRAAAPLDYAIVGIGVALGALFLWQPVAGIAESAQFSPRRVAWRFLKITPYGLLPLAAFVSWQQRHRLATWIECEWADGVLAGSAAAEWKTTGKLLAWLPLVLTVINVSTAVCFVSSSWRERLSMLEGVNDDRVRPRGGGMLLLSGGVFGGLIARQLFGKSWYLRPVILSLIIVPIYVVLAFFVTRAVVRAYSADVNAELAEAIEVLNQSRGQEWVVARLMALADSPEPEVRSRSRLAMVHTGEGMRVAIPKLVAEIPGATRPSRDRLILLLDRIDPQWAKSSGTSELIPALCEIVSDVTWADAAWAQWRGKGRTGEMGRSASELTESRGTIVLDEPGGGRMTQRVIQILNEVDPQWTTTDSGRRVIESLRAVRHSDGSGSSGPGQDYAADAILRRIDSKKGNDGP